jgi:DNA-binding LacI/PurR family transcriptional regulator
MPVRIRDVAERARVSTATVSRVLNHPDTVAPELRERVLEAVEELDFRPNRLARNFRRRRSDFVGVVVSDLSNPHFGVTVKHIENSARANGLRVLLCSTEEDPEREEGYLSLLADERPAGVIIAPTHQSSGPVAKLLDQGIAVVAIDRPAGDSRADVVMTDHREIGRLATRHLLDLGHTDVAFIGGERRIYSVEQRYQGYVDELRKHDLNPLEKCAGFESDDGYRNVSQLLESKSPTAVVAATNVIGHGVLLGLRDRGCRVPDDVALIGIDDPLWASVLGVTTLAQPIQQIAEAAVSLLTKRIVGRADYSPEEILYPPTLHIRGSSCTSDAASSPAKTRSR